MAENIEMSEASADDMRKMLDRQKKAHLNDGLVSNEVRQDRLERAVNVIKKNQEKFVDAMSADFGHRSRHQSLFSDIALSISPLRHAQKNLKRWRKSEKRSARFPLNLLGAKARIDYQPLGVVGLISPWNFPVNLTFAPLAGVLSAGNRVMIKPSEYTPETSNAMAKAISEEFDTDEMAVVLGGPETGAAFSSLPFDHLLFTGATSIAKQVLSAAAKNLVPVTLELGGKSPVIVSESANMDSAAGAIMAGKMMNAGQICLSPDYVLVPKNRVREFVESSKKAVTKTFPTLMDNPDYTSVINETHFDRLNSYIDEAKQKGVEVVEINPANEDFDQQPHNKIPPTLIIDPPEELQVMQNEIFGPVMPIKSYDQIEETISYVNDRPRPLGLYYFGSNKKEESDVLNRTTSGGVTVNDVVMHYLQEDLPFGGIGPSGMGSYHGEDGFKRFSHAKAIYSQTKVGAVLEALRPPYGDSILKMAKSQSK